MRTRAVTIAYDIGLYCWLVAMITAYCLGLGWSALAGMAGCLALVCRLAWDPEFRKRAVPLPIDYAVLAIGLIETVGLARSIYYRNTLQAVIDLTTLVSVYYVLRLSMIGRHHRVGIWLVGATAGLLLSFATIGKTIYVHMVFASYNLGNASNLRSVLSVPVSGGSGSEKLSVLLALLPFPVLLSVEFWRKNRGVSVLGIASVFMLLVSIALTLSRGMYLALMAFVLVLLALLLRYSATRWQRLVLTTVLLLAPVCVAIAPWRHAVATTALMNRTSMQVRSTHGRAELWRMYVTAAKAHPLLGIGRGNLGLLPVRLDGRAPAEGYVFASAFNTAIMLLIETGAIGLCCYLALLGAFLVSGLRYLRSGLEELDLLEMSLCLAAVLSLCTRDLTACTILTQPMTALLVTILAAMASRPWALVAKGQPDARAC